MADQVPEDAELDSIVSATRAGVQVVTAPDAAGAAIELAQRTGGEVLSDASSTAAAIAARSVGEAQVEELRLLARDLTRADRIRTRTRAGVTDTIARQRSGSTGIELHSSSLREAARAITDLEAELEPLQLELTSLEQALLSSSEAQVLPAMFDDAAIEAARNRIVAVGTTIAFMGVSLMVFALSRTLLAPAIVLLIGVALAVAMLRRHPAEASAPEAEVIDVAAEERRLGRRAELTTSISSTTERMRSARRHWAALVGAGVDPRDIDTVLRSRDAQYDVSRATHTSPTIRMVDTLHRRAAARWRVAWAALGVDDPPAPDELDARVHAITHDARPLVLVDPVRWLPADRLSDLLQRLPAHVDVYIIKQR
jgi:hypothetical protein